MARRTRHYSARIGAGLYRLRCNRLCDRYGCVRDRLHARHRRRRSAYADLHRIHIIREHCTRGRAVGRTGIDNLGHPRAGAQLWRHQHRRRGITMRDRLIFTAQLVFTALVAAFLIVPAVLSMLAGLVVGIPAAYALHLRDDRLSRTIEEIITLPLAIPGLAIALALLLTYGGFSDFRRSWLFILAGHAVFTLPFMVRSVMAVFGAIDLKSLDEGAASLGALSWRRFRDVIVPNAAPGILAGS